MCGSVGGGRDSGWHCSAGSLVSPHKGEVYLTTKGYKSALRVYEETASLDTQRPYPHSRLDNGCWVVGREQDAIKEHQTATDLTPGLACLERELERARQAIAATAPRRRSL